MGRLFLLFLALPALLPLLSVMFSGGGGSDDPTAPRTSFSLADSIGFVWFESRIFLVLGSAILGAAAVHGWGAAVRGLRYAFLEPRSAPSTEAEPALVSRAEALALMARLTVFGALLVSFAAVFSDLAMIRAVLDGTPYGEFGRPGRMRGMAEGAGIPLAALFLGRLWLGGTADAALRHSGRPERSAFRSRDDFAALLFLVPIALQLFLGFYSFPVR